MGPGEFYSSSEALVYVVLAIFDGLISVVAAVQLLRLYFCDRLAGWTRQKIFHCLILASNFGYTSYFLVSLLASRRKWSCWSHACGFMFVAIPQTIFLATFLLLLSFWVDLCHQATDKEEDDDEDDEEVDEGNDDFPYTTVPEAPESERRKVERSVKKSWTCFGRRLRVRGRQKLVILSVLFICALTLGFGFLIWYGTGDNEVDSGTVAEAYSYLYAVVILLSGGGLASYGLGLYTKMSKLRSGQASDDITKVAGLAVVSVVCFTVRASMIFFSNIPVINIWPAGQGKGDLAAILTFCYHCIGESIPSAVVLWVMRKIPRGSLKTLSHEEDDQLTRTRSQAEAEQALLLQHAMLEQWMISEAAVPNDVSRSSFHKSLATTSPTPPAEVERYSYS